MELYHGSVQIISSPLVSVGRKGLDFGPGFYMTSFREQAIKWARRVGVIRFSSLAYLNKYELDEEKFQSFSPKHKLLMSYNREWLDFVVASRRGESPWQAYDVIEGGVANDQVIDTVEDYYSGRITAEQALGQLCFAKPTHQICINSQELADCCLHFVGCEQIELL